MRAYLKIQAKNCMIPIDHRDQLIQIIHRWLGWEKTPQMHPPFSFSRFEGGRNSLQGISFMDDTTFFFSSPDASLVKKLAAGVNSSPTLFNGLKVIEVKTVEDPDLSKRELFYAASPLLLTYKVSATIEYIVFNAPNAEAFLKQHTLNKLNEAGISDTTFDIGFDPNYTNAGTKKIIYNGNTMRTSWCQIILKGLPETKQFIWNIGLGDGNEIGFGAIM